MQVESYLHDLKDFRDLIQVVSRERRILPQLIEKDYWIMHVLYGLAAQGFVFELKGGTSLSKGYRIIERFSEDIDIRIEPPIELQVMVGKNHQNRLMLIPVVASLTGWPKTFAYRESRVSIEITNLTMISFAALEAV